jgi:hypothetical protein
MQAGFPMSEKHEEPQITELEQISTELARSLNRCRRLLFDFRSDVAANSNMPELLDDDSENRLA